MPLPSGEPFEPSFSMDDPEVPVTGFEPPLIIPSWVAPITLGSFQLTGIVTSLEY